MGVVLEGNVKRGTGVFSHVRETGDFKGEVIVYYKGEFSDGFLRVMVPCVVKVRLKVFGRKAKDMVTVKILSRVATCMREK